MGNAKAGKIELPRERNFIMKHILPIMLSICLALTIPCPIFAADPTSVVIVQPTEESENGYYIETTLEYLQQRLSVPPQHPERRLQN